ncbi:hypothetical protein [Pinisolibacter aquiterrae]|uniref:hypothetical protein n=1 Tax=Pinisolibacter aquiterrae TaxID=2815579 RepID=UPI001C3DA9FA|nr:hypothetical protein [Pinisolibacter aquiterrae]MBV5265974.1 hypothetical protein [Pinisolibacter aquiterrae]MCC8237169.1 hypothetical protein [Pinisolibacter aquiterrae]
MSLSPRSPTITYLRSLLTLPPAAPSRAVGFDVAVAAFAAAVVLLALDARATLGDGDTPWHVFVGGTILDTGRFPTTDTLSWTVTGAPWIAKEWLSQVILAGAFRLGGWPAVALTTIAAAALAFAVIAREAFARLSPLAAGLLIALAYPLAAGAVLARPHTLAWVPMVVWTLALIHAAETARRPPLLVLLAMVVWTNLHGSFLLGLALVPAFAVEAILRAAPADRFRLGFGWAAFLVAAVAATLIHPYGWGVWRAAVSVIGLEGIQSLIMEWQPQSFARIGPLELLLLGGIALLATTRTRISAVRLAVVLMLLHMALAHVRHGALLGLLGPLVLIEPLARVAGPGTRTRFALSRGVGALWGLIGLVAAALVVVRPPALPTDHAPAAALAAVRAAGIPGEVMNGYSFGGWLISRGVPTYIDGRTELYGGDRVALYRDGVNLQTVDAFDRLLADPRIGWTLLSPGLPIVGLLDRTPGWRRLYADSDAVVHVRTPR